MNSDGVEIICPLALERNDAVKTNGIHLISKTSLTAKG